MRLRRSPIPDAGVRLHRRTEASPTIRGVATNLDRRMSLDRKIYLATVVAAMALIGVLWAAAPLLAGDVIVHVAQTASAR